MRFLDKLREFLRSRGPLVQDQTGAPTDLELQAATTILLIEAAFGDEEYVWREHRAIARGDPSHGLARNRGRRCVVEEWEESFADHIGRAVGLSGEEARAARESSRS